MFEFSVSKMLALEKVRDIVLDNKHGLRYVGVETIEPFMYDHKRTLALKKHGHWRDNEPMLPEWEWIIVREDWERFRMRTDYNKPIKGFRANRYPLPPAPPPETVGPPSTGPGHNSKRDKDGKGYFKKVMTTHFPPPAPRAEDQRHPDPDHRGSGASDQQFPDPANRIMDNMD